MTDTPRNDVLLPLTDGASRRLARLRFASADAAAWNAATAALGEPVPPESPSEPVLWSALAGQGALFIDAQEPAPSELISWWCTLQDLAPWPTATGVLWGPPLGGGCSPALLCVPGGEVACIDHARLVLGPGGDRLAVAELPATGGAAPREPIELGPLPPAAIAALRACDGSLEELFRRAARQVERADDGTWRVRVPCVAGTRPSAGTAPRIH